MVKRKRCDGEREQTHVFSPIVSTHAVSDEDIQGIRESLLCWYDENKRDLPWRQKASNPNRNERAYAVWVSEIMLQQTQVVTVINYYNKWMKKWPTLQDLAKADLEEVNEMWSGLGYYSRGRRLLEGAQKVVNELNGEMPGTAEELMKQLPGVGRYTAAAIASIAFSQPVGLVDGNVVRVLCRLCMISADSSSQTVIDTLWSHANTLVDRDNPGDFNQSVMELGATVCTPKSPACDKCPVKTYCKALAKVNHEKAASTRKLATSDKIEMTIPDIECLTENCRLCSTEKESWNISLGVTNYPRKGQKKTAREERTRVLVICRKDLGKSCNDYFIVQRPSKGLLASLWEFPSIPLNQTESGAPNENEAIFETLGLKFLNPPKWKEVGEVVHIFSHIHQTYEIWEATVDRSTIKHELSERSEKAIKWVTKEQFYSAAVSTAMKKVFKAFESSLSTSNKKVKKAKIGDHGQQPNINSFFKRKDAS